MAKHAVLSPSSSARWLACPGSVRLIPAEERRTSRAAAEGTVAHEIAAECIEMGRSPVEFIGREFEQDGFTIEFTAEMADDLAKYVDEALDAIGDNPYMVEQSVPLEQLTGEKDATGTADLLIFRAYELEVRDLKFGRGVEVDSEDNTQLIMYALGALEKFATEVGDVTKVRCTIHQPRLAGPKETVYTIEELAEWGKIIIRGAKNTAAKDAPLIPTNDGCKFCPAKATCPALRAEILASTESDFDDLTSRDAEQLAADLHRVERVEAWTKAVRAEVERRLIAGTDVPGWKLVAGRRGARKWIDESDAIVALEQHLGPDAWKKSLISPTEAGKILKGREELFDGLVTSSEGKPSVAPATDRRPAITVTPTTDDFDNLEETE